MPVTRRLRHALSAARVALSAVAPASRAALEVSDMAASMCPEDYRVAKLRAGGFRPPPQEEHEPGKHVMEEDLESDEATWALYERWCKAYNKERDHGDMARRFNIFKKAAKDVHTINTIFYMYEPEKHRGLGPSADGFNAQEVAQLKNKLTRMGFATHIDAIEARLVQDIPAADSP